MDMVRRGVIPRRREASCCRVEVMKGGAGDFCFSPRLTLFTVKGAFSVSRMTVLTSASLFSSCFLSPLPKKRALKLADASPQFRQASSSQYSWLLKLRISSSRSTTMRVATDWTRPADRPVLILRHRKGDSS